MPDQRSSHPWVGCIRIPDFPVQVELARRPELRGRPVVITAPAAGGATAKTPVTHCSPEAAEQGVRPGMPVREVIATCREAVLLSPDPEWYRSVHDAFLDALEEEAPVVEDADLGLAYVDLTGMERLYPQGRPPFGARGQTPRERGLKAFAAGPEPEKAFDVRAAAGPNKFVACVAALVALKDRPRIVLRHEARRFLAPHAFVSSACERRKPAPPRPLWLGAPRPNRQAGPYRDASPVWRGGALDLGAGPGDRHFAAGAPPPVSSHRGKPFFSGAGQRLGRLLGGSPAACHPGVAAARSEGEATVRQLVLSARIDEEVWEKSITFHEPVGDPERLQAMLRRRLEGTELPGAVSAVTLKLTLLGGAYVGQEALFPGSGQRLRRLKEALAAVKARYGTTGLYRIAEVEPWSRIPERRYALISFEP